MKQKNDKRPRAAALRTKSAQRKTTRAKVQAYRARMRAKGLRLVQMWLPDTSTPEFAAAAHRASLAIARSPAEKDDQAFVDSVSWINSEDAAREWTDPPPSKSPSRHQPRRR